MQAYAISMIDQTAQTADMITPAKTSGAHSQEFGKVLDKQRQAERPEQAEVKAKPVEKQETRQVEKQEAKPVEKQETKQDAKTAEQPVREPKEQVAEEKQQATVAEAEETAKPQQTLINLMKVIAGGETPELVEEFGSSEELLNQLVQQLDGAELKGEQVLAGIDLTSLVEQLQTLTEEGGEGQLSKLAEQLGNKLEEQQADEEGLLLNSELAAVAMPNAELQQQAPQQVENLAQARQILQKAIDAVVAQQQPASAETEETVVAETAEIGTELLGSKEAGEQIDARFAGLLQPRSENRPQGLKSQAQGEIAKQSPLKAKEEAAAVQAPVELAAGKKVDAEVDFSQLLNETPKQGVEKLVQQLQGQVQHGPVAFQHQSDKVMPTQTPMVQLPSGQQVAESQIFDQVVTRFVGSSNGESGRMVLRLQPAELGSLKIELQVEGDRIRANLHAQSIQVQEVLERNLPQLRNALAEQGLKIDQFQVNVSSDQGQQGQFDQLAQQQQQRQNQQQPAGWQRAWDTEEQVVPLAHLMQNGGGGISLHV